MDREETSRRNSDDDLKRKIHALQKKVYQLKKRKRELQSLVNEDADDVSSPPEIKMNFYLSLS